MDGCSEDLVVELAEFSLAAEPPGSELALSPDGPWRIPAPVEVQLRALARGRQTPASVVLRARIVLSVCFEGRSRAATARTVGVTRDTVRLWVRRFEAHPTAEALHDRARSGRPPRITLHDQALVLSLACQKPQDIGRCEARMFHDILREEAARRGSVMSLSSVQRILASAEVQPHREKYYLFTRKDDPEYVRRRDAICDLYTRSLPPDEIVICFDEKTGVQVRGVPAKTPLGGWQGAVPGQPARVEQHYCRHGARTIVGAVRPDTGRLVASGVYAAGQYKTAQTIELFRAIRKALPQMRRIHVVEDNGSTHRSADMKAFLASEEGQVFSVLYTPVHASWLNLAENFLSRFSRRYLNGKRWTGLDVFDADMAVCFEAYQGVAKPMRWRYNPRERAETQRRRRSASCPAPSSDSRAISSIV
jgi:transposase